MFRVGSLEIEWCFAGSHTFLDMSGIDCDKYRVILTLPILSRLRRELRLEWSRDGKGFKSDLKLLLAFPEKEIQWRECFKCFYTRWGLVLSFLWKNVIRKLLPPLLSRLLPPWSPVRPTVSVEKVMIPLRKVLWVYTCKNGWIKSTGLFSVFVACTLKSFAICWWRCLLLQYHWSVIFPAIIQHKCIIRQCCIFCTTWWHVWSHPSAIMQFACVTAYYSQGITEITVMIVAHTAHLSHRTW